MTFYKAILGNVADEGHIVGYMALSYILGNLSRHVTEIDNAVIYCTALLQAHDHTHITHQIGQTVGILLGSHKKLTLQCIRHIVIGQHRVKVPLDDSHGSVQLMADIHPYLSLMVHLLTFGMNLIAV